MRSHNNSEEQCYWTADTMTVDGSLQMSDSRIPPSTPDTSALDIRSRWKPFIEDHDAQSYSYYLPQYDYGDEENDNNNNNNKNNKVFDKTQLAQWFRELHPASLVEGGDAWTDAMYKGERLLRKTAWVVLEDECSCEYGYSDTWQPMAKSPALLQTLKEVTAAVTQVTGCAFNSCNLNYYPQGGGVGFHADDEFLFDGLNRDTRIVSLSLCGGDSAAPASTSSTTTNWGARKFMVKRKLDGEHEDDAQEDQYSSTTSSSSSSSTGVQEMLLRHGDLMTMEGMFQKHYFHSIWPGDSKEFMDHPLTQGERINLTWRTIVKHLDGSDECLGKSCPLSAKNR
jgi:alkylated DNA repair dioxygenase AlkB